MDRSTPPVRRAAILTPLVVALAVSGFWPGAHVSHQQVPRTFDEAGLKDFELPLPDGMIVEHDAPQLHAALEGAFSRQA